MTPSKPSAVSPYFPLSRRKTAWLLRVAPPGLPEDCEDCYAPTFAKLYSHLELLKPALIQERVADDPWKLLTAVTLLNKTAGRLAIPSFWEILSKWPTPWELSQANESDLTATIRHLGTSTVRAKRLIDLSRTYLQDPPSHSDPRPSRATIPRPVSFRKYTKYPPTPVSHLPGTGPYALDSYRIFCTVNNDFTSEEWMTVMPSDKELIKYLKWKWAAVEHKKWVPGFGLVGPADITYLKDLISELTVGYV